MRTAAGVLLIIMALVNGLAGLGYLGIGGLASVVGEAADEVAEEQAREGATAEETAETKKAGQEAKEAGALWMGMGLLCVLLLGLQIAAAVLLFQNKKATFVMIVAGLGLLSEILGIALTTFGILNIFGIVVAVFAFLGARAITERPAAA